MSYKITWETILDEFVGRERINTDDIFDWYPSGQLELTIKLKDGTKLIYDYLSKTVRCIGRFKNEDELTEEDYRLEFAIKLRRKTKMMGLTQDALASESGISPRMISKYFNGTSLPSVYVAKKLAKTLKCSISEICDFY